MCQSAMNLSRKGMHGEINKHFSHLVMDFLVCFSQASKDDLSFDRVGDDDGLEKRTRRAAADSLDLMDTMGSTLDKPDTREVGQ